MLQAKQNKERSATEKNYIFNDTQQDIQQSQCSTEELSGFQNN